MLDKTITFMDPYGRERECGLTRRRLLNLAKREGWPIRRIFGRQFIGGRAYRQWLHRQPFVRLIGPRTFRNIETGLCWTYAARRQNKAAVKEAQ